jgi:hypothetical protein
MCPCQSSPKVEKGPRAIRVPRADTGAPGEKGDPGAPAPEAWALFNGGSIVAGAWVTSITQAAIAGQLAVGSQRRADAPLRPAPGSAGQSPGGCRATKPLVERGSDVQREPVSFRALVS